MCPQTGWVEGEKWAFSEGLERMVGLVEALVMMCIAGDYNGHELGEEGFG